MIRQVLEYRALIRGVIIMAPSIAAAILCLMTVAQPTTSQAQTRGTPAPAPTPAPATATAPRGGQRGTAAKPPTPLTLRQVIESLSATRSSVRAEGLVSKAGV